MIDSPDAIGQLVHRLGLESGPSFERLCARIVSHYGNRSALAGGVSALPGLVPGLGTVTVLLGTTLLEMAAVLKLEVEMCMALSRAHGFDIHDRRERQLALLLAAVQTHEVESGRNVLLDIGVVSTTAVWNYTPRELEKVMLKVFSALALVWASKYVTKGILHAVPFVGVGIGAGVNKVLTTRVGRSAQAALTWRVRERAALQVG
jgi:hypothetical protein